MGVEGSHTCFLLECPCLQTALPDHPIESSNSHCLSYHTPETLGTVCGGGQGVCSGPRVLGFKSGSFVTFEKLPNFSEPLTAGLPATQDGLERAKELRTAPAKGVCRYRHSQSNACLGTRP